MADFDYYDPSLEKDKNGVATAPSISLPKGGGAIKSIDEKFSVNAVNGTAGFSIPLPFSAARGYSPGISLSYSSGSGNGVFGLGWSMGLSSIKRKTQNELPRYFDEIDSDTFIFSGAEDLVPEFIKDATGTPIKDKDGNYTKNEFTSPDGLFKVRRYNPRIDGLFARIERWTETLSGIVHWRIISKNNHTSLLGIRPQSRLSDPLDPEKIFEWLPDFTFDDKGNCAVYQYKKEDGVGLDRTRMYNKNRINGNAPFTDTYLTHIRYGNTIPYAGNGSELYSNRADALYTDPDFSISGTFLFETIFDYGQQIPIGFDYNNQAPGGFLYDNSRPWIFRPDPFSQYLSGFEIRTCRLCYRVLLYHYFAELPGGSALVRSIDFDYTNNGNEGFTFLSHIRQNGFIKHNTANDATTYTAKSFPPFAFDYQKIAWDPTVRAVSAGNLENAPSGIDEIHYKFVDLYSEGLSGMLTEQAGGLYYKTNLMSGVFTPAKLVSPKPSFSGLAKEMQFMDLEGNGRKQLVNWQHEPKGYFELSDEEDWQSFHPFRQLPNINFSDPDTRLLDLDGDGRADILITEDDVFTWYSSCGKDGFKPARKLPRSADEEKGPAIVFSEPLQTIFLADMNGDGKTDIVRIRNGQICYWPNLGYGKFGAKVSMDGAPIFDHPDHFNPRYIKLADIDGSGTSDIIYIGKNSFTIWLNQNGNYFSSPRTIPPFPGIDNLTEVSVFDLLGTGLGCLVWNSSLPKDSAAPLRYIDLVDSKKPHIMVSYKNNLGKEIALEYAPSTQYYVADKLAGTPWVTRLHFPVYCVSKVTSHDRITKTRQASTYTYHHGYYDHYEKEFRGFGRVDQTDCEEIDHFVLTSAGASNNVIEQDLHQSPVLTRTWFHTGAFLSKDLILNQFAHEYFQNPGIENDLSEPLLPAGLTIDEWREALRACKGILLRKEVYGQDNSAQQNIPYLAEQHNALIRMLQPRGGNKYAVCLTHASEAMSYHYERNASDPRIAHEMIFEVDQYANVLSSASIVYARLGTPDTADPLIASEQLKQHILFHRFAYTNAIVTDPDNYRTPLTYSGKTYEVTSSPGPPTLKIFPDPVQTAYYDQGKLGDYCNNSFPAATLDSASGTLIEYTRTLYCPDTGSSAPLAAGLIDTKGLVYESYKAVFTQAMLSGLHIPGFNLNASDTLLQDPTQGAFIYEENYYWAPSGRHNYDAAHFYLSTAYTDPFGNTTTVGYDNSYYLYLQNSTDALGNKTSVSGFNFRTLSPYLMTDMNGNRAGVRSDEMGVVINTFQMGKAGENKGDLMDTTQAESSPQDQPTTILEYAFDEWYDQSNAPGFDIAAYYKPQPNYVHTKVRTTHYYTDNGLADPSPVTWLETYSYSDGGGHALLQKVQADPGDALQVNPGGSITTVKNGPRWIGNGRTILNNKGNPVKKYEPYFSVGFQFDDEKDMVELGVTAILTYDAPGRSIRKDLPDGTFSKTEFDPWKQLSYDQNDTVIDSSWFKSLNPDLSQAEPTDPLMRAAWCAAQDYNTPLVSYLDTLGRPIVTQQMTTPSAGIISKTVLDIQGNTLQVIDARNNIVVSHQYNMLGHPLSQNSMDAGQRWMLNNVGNKPLFKWDERNHVFSFTYDALLRPLTSQVTGGDGPVPLNSNYEKIIYGETLGMAAGQAGNFLGRPHIVYDQAGAATCTGYDFKGNLSGSSRQFTNDYKDLPDWNIPSPASLLISVESYTSSSVVDALNRVIQAVTPDGSTTARTYNLTGLLQTVTITQPGGSLQLYVQHIDYDAKGQRNSILYGNGVMTSYQYDPYTFRLTHLVTRDGGGNTLQDLSYVHDPAGNIMQQSDACVPTVFFKNYEINGVSLYEYDTLYRLVSASGREHAGQLAYGATDNWDDVPFAAQYNANDNLAWQNYTQKYVYDTVGNIQQISHTVSGTAGWVRDYTYETFNNRLINTAVGAETYPYAYHPRHGFMTAMPHLQVMNWNFRDELQTVAAQKVNAGAPETTWYVYDGGGQRVRKITENSAAEGQSPTQKCERIYVGGIEIYRQYTGANAGLQRQTLHIMDDQRRIAMIETRNGVDDGTAEVSVRYQFGNHLGSACLELDDTAQVISYEEYHPYGTTSYQANNGAIKTAAKRYRYTGMERDEESGLGYHSARYYVPWLGRWTAPDPIGVKGGANLYAYCANNPVGLTDTNGQDPSGNPFVPMLTYQNGRLEFVQPFAFPVVASADQKFNDGVHKVLSETVGLVSEDKNPKRNDKPKINPVSEFLLNMVSDTVETFFGGSAANAPSTKDVQLNKTQERQSYAAQAVNVALFMLPLDKIAGYLGKGALRMVSEALGSTTERGFSSFFTLLLKDERGGLKIPGTKIPSEEAGEAVGRRLPIVNPHFTPSITPETAFQGATADVAARLSANRQLIPNYLTPGELRLSTYGPWGQRIVFGNAVERGLAQGAKPTELLLHVGDIRPAPLGGSDFLGVPGTPYEGLRFQVTTFLQYLRNHLANSPAGTVFGLYQTFDPN